MMEIVAVLIGLLLLLAVYVLVLIYQKMQIVQQCRLQYPKLKTKKMATRIHTSVAHHERLQLVEEYEQQLFDDAATLFTQQHMHVVMTPAVALQLEAEWLKKMPAKTQAYIRHLDLAEWSIFWTFFDQSLECYVGKYGIFYTHVDRFGQEHRHVRTFSQDEADLK